MSERFSSLKGMIWDLDNTLYRFNAPLEKEFNRAIAHAALEWGVDLTPEEAIAIAEESWITHRYSAFEFMLRYNIPQADLHHLTDKHLDDQYIQKCDLTCNLFSRGSEKHALITHSARPWALKILKRLELDPWFPDPQVFAYEDYAFESKAKSRKPFEVALESINHNACDTVMVEDTLENLKIPHEMGIMTVYLHHGRPVDELPSFVDYHTDNVRDLLDTVYAVKPYSKASL